MALIGTREMVVLGTTIKLLKKKGTFIVFIVPFFLINLTLIYLNGLILKLTIFVTVTYYLYLFYEY